jgi:hypothetical protein
VKTRRAPALIRVSDSRSDVARQEKDIRRIREEHDLDITHTVELHGVSGTAVLNDEQVRQVLYEIAQPDQHGLAASALDRLARPADGEDYRILDGFKKNRKFLWTKSEGELRLWKPADWTEAINTLAHAYLELCKIRQRSMDGKQSWRERGCNVNGPATLPEGIGYRRITGAGGRTVGGEWFYGEPEHGRVVQAYELLFEDRYLLADIERMVGWGRGRIRTLRNPAWKGLRIYPPTAEAAEEGEGILEVPIPLKPVLTPERWELAQQLLLKRRTWSRETSEQRFLSAGLLVCECGLPYYVQANRTRGRHDYYYCSSRLRRPPCGACQLRRVFVDGIIEQLVVEHLTDAAFLKEVFARLEAPATPLVQDPDRELAKLAARREKWITEFDEDRITKQEFEERMDAVKKAVREVEAKRTIVPKPSLDVPALVLALARWAVRFPKIPDFLEKRAELKRVIKRIPVADTRISTVELSGAFLGSSADIKAAQQYSAS